MTIRFQNRICAAAAITFAMAFGSASGSAYAQSSGSESKPVTKSATLQESENAFRQIVPKLHTFTRGNVLYDRFQSYGKPRYSDPEQKYFEEIDSDRHNTANLLKLLKDTDPKMRTLAIAALYAKEDPSVLPAIAQLVDDNANTFSEPIPIARAYGKVEDAPKQVLTVGQVAKDVVDFYMSPAGFNYGVKGSGPNNPGFNQYWQERRNRKYCASWFLVKLQRASTGVTPTDKSRSPQIAAVKAALNKVPTPERDWILLWLPKEGGFDLFASERELVSAMKQLGPDKLLLMLQCKKVIDDPDMQPRRNNNYT